MDVQNDARRFLGQFEKVFPGTSQWNGKAKISVPGLDPSFAAAYSYRRVGQYTERGSRSPRSPLERSLLGVSLRR